MSFILDCMGGLGNQLFQYAAAVALSAYYPVYITKPRNNGHSSKDYRDTLLTRIPKFISEYPPNNIQTVGPSDAFTQWSPGDIHVEQLCRLHGYFQYLPAIESVLPQIVEDILTSLTPLQDTMRNKYGISEPSATAFLHVRRGDYLRAPAGHHWVQDEKYYTEALTHFPTNLRWLVISDDPVWCRAQPWLSSYEVIDEPDELAGLALQSLCHGGAIIGNSTYSWWGAMIGAARFKAPVVYPSKWFKNERVQIFPPTWIVV